MLVLTIEAGLLFEDLETAMFFQRGVCLHKENQGKHSDHDFKRGHRGVKGVCVWWEVAIGTGKIEGSMVGGDTNG